MAALVLVKSQNFRCIFKATALTQASITCSYPLRRYSSDGEGKKKKKSTSKYKDTVLLPKTDFPLWLDPRLRPKHDAGVIENCGFNTLYNWQRDNLGAEEFVLHDGPPYANGSPHVGHAVNKILKDIIIRREMLNGHRIHYVPGWDCHGLPIENKALSDVGDGNAISSIQIRQQARRFAAETINQQKKVFQSWGILADWDGNCYHTFDKSYVQNQLRCFYSLYEKGLVYRDMKPVYWSPSSRTALAEAELQYNDHHKSICVTLRISLLTRPFNVDVEGPLYALIWTTTPWTLPANEAVTYKSDLEYSIVNIENLDGHYIVAAKLVPSLEKSLSKKVAVVQNILGKSLKRATYRHPFFKQEEHKFFHADHVTDDKGTGLVHCAPAHGREDYVVAVQNKLKLVCLVDKQGNYVESAGPDLMGQSIMGEGSKTVRALLQNDIIHTEELEHSYPYDWRTNKPVFLLASEQWFFDCSAIRDAAGHSLENIKYAPGDSHKKAMIKLVKERPFWCISRQRAWGVPIPALFKRGHKEPIISKALVDHYCDLIDKHGTDFWWTLSSEDILPGPLASELGIDRSDMERCPDILDIWFDSGLSWSAVLDGRIADIYLEGSDQLTGWFQSSLLTSVALTGKPPYKKIFTHGFVVDENGQKMSKSIGNVVDPQTITKGGEDLQKEPPFGVDAMRWWAAAHSVQHTNIPISMNLIRSSSDVVQKLRGTLKYALGVLNDFPLGYAEKVPSQDFFLLDRYMLQALHKLSCQIGPYYESHKYNLICNTINDFVVNEVSNIYLTLTKDRLFCDKAESGRRRAAQLVMYSILETLLQLVAPITPLLVEEVYQHHPVHAGKKRFFEYRSKTPFQVKEEWLLDGVEANVKAALLVKNALNKISDGKSTWGKGAEVQVSPDTMDLLQPLCEGHPSESCQLTEILQVGCITLKPLPERVSSESGVQVQIYSLDSTLCVRCRRHAVREESDICVRCMEVLDSPLNALKHSFL